MGRARSDATFCIVWSWICSARSTQGQAACRLARELIGVYLHKHPTSACIILTNRGHFEIAWRWKWKIEHSGSCSPPIHHLSIAWLAAPPFNRGAAWRLLCHRLLLPVTSVWFCRHPSRVNTGSPTLPAIKIFSRLPFLLRQTTVHTFLLLSNTPSSRNESSSFTIAASTSEVNPTRPASRRSPSAHFCCFAGRDRFETHPRTCAYRGGTGQLSRPRSSNRQDAEDLVYGTSPPGRGRARSASGRESC